MSRAQTRGLRIEAEATYLPHESSPRDRYYLFAYRVRISNHGERSAQLLGRRWVIADAEGREHSVEGHGVGGGRPILAPGGEFEYISHCPLPTEVGAMRGVYRAVTEEGRAFDAAVDWFTLAVPFAVN